jgi:hypothetical protein
MTTKQLLAQGGLYRAMAGHQFKLDEPAASTT